MLRSVAAVFSTPIVYGMLCVPGNWIVVQLFPQHFDENWVTSNSPLLLFMVSLTLVWAGASGLVGGYIAKRQIMKHTIVMAVLLLGIAVYVQSLYWNLLPIWYHFSLFILVVIGVIGGAEMVKETR